jgi:hypothetical protein
MLSIIKSYELAQQIISRKLSIYEYTVNLSAR